MNEQFMFDGKPAGQFEHEFWAVTLLGADAFAQRRDQA
jgi:hypothetical protein